MRSKDDILYDVKNDIHDENYQADRNQWLVHRQVEVLIDIRDSIRLLDATLATVLKLLNALLAAE